MPTTLTIGWVQWVVGVILPGLFPGIGNAIGSQIGIRLHGKLDKAMKWIIKPERKPAISARVVYDTSRRFKENNDVQESPAKGL